MVASRSVTSDPSFSRYLSPEFVAALERLTDAPEGNWWQDVLARRDLVVAVRRDALNVYYRGASIFLIELQGDRPAPTTHAKYLTRRQQGQVPLQADGSFAIDPTTALWGTYAGPETLVEMMRAASDLAGPEKLGLHALLLASPHVIDVEVALDGSDTHDDDDGVDDATLRSDGDEITASARKTARRQDRLDVATLEERDGQIFVVFHEAKHFSNPELRAAPDRQPPVAGQIERYRRALGQHAPAIARSYQDVCCALLKIDAMRQRVLGSSSTESRLDPLVARVAQESITPVVDLEPRLVVFGFDRDQRDGPVWSKHRERLTGVNGFQLKLYAIGDTGAKRSPAFR